MYFWPPLWFLGLEEVLIGRPEAVFLQLTRIAVGAFAIVVLVAAATYLAAFIVHQRRLRTQAPIALRPAALARSSVLRRIAALIAPDALTRATFLFTAQTLARSARHRLCIAGYMGLGLACVTASILAAHFRITIGRSPLDLTSMAFAAQTNLVFFLLVGVRVAAGFPADLNAAWAFRIRVTPALRRYQAGTRWAFVLLGVVPLLLALVPLHVALWGWYPALVHFACGTVLALVLLDVLFRRSDRIPFVSAFAPARTVLSLRLPFYIFGYLIFVYIPPQIERIWMLSRARSVFPKMIAALAAVLALLALTLAMAGLYGVLSYIVAGRTREVGVRMALGATRPRILGGVLYDGLRPVLEGIAVGLALAAFAVALLRPFITRVLPGVDPVTFTLLPIPFVLAALIACYLPARRAAGVDPNVALRQL